MLFHAFGDPICNKTCLLISFTTNAFPGEYVPTVFDNYSTNIIYECEAINLQLWDTAGQSDYAKLRPLSYPQTDIFVICFSLISPLSLENVEKYWLPEIQEHCPDTPYILAGLNSELRDEFEEHSEEYRSKGWEPIPTSEGERMKNKIHARAYIEASALKQYHLKEIFDEAITVVLHPLHGIRDRNVNCVVVGDSVCDIPTFLYNYTIWPNPKKEDKVFFEKYSRHIDYKNKVINLQLTHTSTEGNDENLLPLSSPQIDVIILCFSLISPSSLERISSFWLPQIQQQCPNVPYILAGLKADLRNDFKNHEDEFRENG